ncbi:MAG TPA: amidase family protein, partial [Candidatus Eisenbacteria bacterium]|nr:amidase family protein [Candidatus Eisenbacteria bacterium]
MTRAALGMIGIEIASTTFGTRLFADNVPTESAPMVERLEAAGAIQLGKTNTPMMGWIGATHNLLFGIT